MRELAIEPEHVFPPFLRLFYLQSSPSIAVKLETSVSEHQADEYILLLIRDRTDHSLSIPDFPADCLLGSDTTFVKSGVGRSPQEISSIQPSLLSQLLEKAAQRFSNRSYSQLFNLQS